MKNKILQTIKLEVFFKKELKKNKASTPRLGTALTTNAGVITRGPGGHINEGLPTKAYWQSYN